MTDTNNDKETLMSDLGNANAKDIKKGLKEFREKHKDKNYNEYVNMYNENKKETFESYWNKNFKEYDDNNDEQMFNLTFRELKQLKQLHDQEIKEKDNKIKELQAEITNLKDTNKYWKRRAENKNKKVMKKKQKTDFEQLNHDRVAYRLQH
jgi:hypothetical protein